MIPIREDGYWEIQGKHCSISIEARPYYCDRGSYIAKLHVTDGVALFIDGSDGWPRYYFDWQRMLDEIEAWMVKREEVV